jgi:hypothetical protein
MSARNGPGAGDSEPPRNKREQRAKELGITAKELKRLEEKLASAASALQGFTPKERTEKAAVRLGLTAPELKDLRRAVAGDGPVTERVSSNIRTVLGASLSRPSPPSRTGGAKKAPPKGPKPSASASKAEPHVFVTKWGQAVHLFHDCVNIRGFRKPHEPDPAIYRVEMKHPCCRGRKACGTCMNHSPTQQVKVKAALKKYHGDPFTEAQWKDESWRRAHPPEPPHIPGG